MTHDTYAHAWPRAGRGRRHRHRAGPPDWFFARGRGRPPVEDMQDLIALGRMWKGGPFGGSGWGPHRRGRGRARRGDVRLALLRLLAEEPRNGYQLIQAIEERSEGLWRPSPGSVYPTPTFQVASVGDPVQREQVRALLAQTRRALYWILAEDTPDFDAGEHEREV